MAEPQAAADPRHALLDAAERLLVRAGSGAITTRRLANEAGLNHGLIHYYFGSMDELLVQVLERYTTALIARQRELYAAPEPFRQRWARAMRYLDDDLASGYQKIWLELQALSWNRPELRDRVARVNAEWRTVLTDAFEDAALEYGIDTDRFPVDALVALVMTFNQGIILERHCGITAGHRVLLDVIDRRLAEAERGATT